MVWGGTVLKIMKNIFGVNLPMFSGIAKMSQKLHEKS